MSRARIIVTSVLLGLVLAGGSFLLGTRFGEPSDEFEPIYRTAEDIRRRSAEPVTTEELVRGAVQGMLDVLDDPYAALLEPQQAREVRAFTSGSTAGLGIWIEGGPDGAVISSVLEGTPAANVGLVPGWVITSVDGRSVLGVPTAEVAAMLQGPEGSSVILGLQTDEGPREVRVSRATIPLDEVRSRLVEGGVAYVRALRFADGTADRVRASLEELLAQGARGVVLDLRGNPGGLTPEAVEVAGLLLGEKVAALVREQGEERTLTPSTEALTDLPAAVLVDGGTASAAELVAGALQDHGRAQLVGTQTFGKGVLLVVSEVEGTDTSVSFATGTFSTPEGHEVEEAGLLPDVPVAAGGPIDAQLDRAVRLVLGEAV